MANDPLAKASGSAANGEIDPKELGRITKSIRGLEQAPSVQQQLGPFSNWKAVQNALGEPFNNERVPITRLRLMRRDPMIAFGLHFQKIPLVRAPWYIESSDPQVAAFIDAALRPIFPSLIISMMNKLDFGFQAIAKRFELRVPDGTYVDDNGNEQPVWSAQPGNIQPVVWKQFVPLSPEGSNPLFDPATGEFFGIDYKPPQGGTAPAGVGAKSKGAGGSSGNVEIDLYHSLWVTNEKEQSMGNIFGYPRVSYTYPYWWSYWFRWAIADRAFEKKGDPAIVVRYPEGEITLDDGSTISNSEYALLIADRIRSGAGIALPSTPYMGVDDRASQVPEWAIEFLKGGVELDPFDKSFNYLDIQKLRGIFVPEQALIEGGGGTSSRNVAEEMYQGLIEAQSILMSECVDTINRFMIPHLLVINFPEQIQQGVQARMKTRGFTAQDTEMLANIIQVIGQNHPEELGVDIREALRQSNLPMLAEKQYQERLAAAAAAAAAAGPGAVPPTKDASGVVPTPGKAPATNGNTPGGDQVGAGGSFTGFNYIPPLGHAIMLSAVTDFMDELPTSVHYQDKTIRALTRQLWNFMHDFYADQYTDFADYLESMEEDISLSDEDGIELATGEIIREMARRLVDNWPLSTDKAQAALDRARQIVNAIAERAAKFAKTTVNIDLPNASEIEGMKTWTDNHAGDVIAKAIATTRSELLEFSASHIDEGKLDPKELATGVRAHFSDFPTWKASRFARTETRDAFNSGYLFAGKAGGFVAAQAIDAQLGDTDADCKHRDGRFFTIEQALEQPEHPNGTLAWRLIKEPVAVSTVDEVPSGIEGSLGWFDDETRTVFLSSEATLDSARAYLHAVGESLS